MCHLAFASSTLLKSLPATAGVLVASVWQGALLTIAVALSLRLVPQLSAAARSAIWTSTLLAVASLPVLLFLEPLGASQGSGLHLARAASFVLVAVWGGASLLRLSQLLQSALRLRGILRRAVPLEPEGAVLSALTEGRRPARLCTSGEVERPSVAGFVHPRILLPPALLSDLSAAELVHIVLHEREHLRRYDDWLNLVQELALVLFPLNPALRWLDRRLSQERELACDDSVLRATRARKAYAACLARVAEHSLVRRSVGLALGILGEWRRRPELARRVDRILANPGPAMRPTQVRLATGLLLTGVLSGVTVLAHSPTLVSFAPNISQSTIGDLAQAPIAVPFASTGGLPRVTLTRAALPSGLAQAPALATLPKQAHRPRLRTVTHNRILRRSAPVLVLAHWDQLPSFAPQTTGLTLTPVAMPEVKTWYTAIPWRDGWIVVQL